MNETDINLLKDKLGSVDFLLPHVLEVSDYCGDLMATVEACQILTVLGGFKERNFIIKDLFAVDYLTFAKKMRERFAVLYNLSSLQIKKRVLLKCFVSEKEPSIDSATSIYRAANWFEREAFDLYGIQFKGHPHLVRILCHHEFVGHPLRKDYPSDGYQSLHTNAKETEF